MFSLCLKGHGLKAWHLVLLSFILSCSEFETRWGHFLSHLEGFQFKVTGLLATSCGDSYLFRRLLVTNLGHPILLPATTQKKSILAEASSMWCFTECSSVLERDEDKWQQKWFPNYLWEEVPFLTSPKNVIWHTFSGDDFTFRENRWWKLS